MATFLRPTCCATEMKLAVSRDAFDCGMCGGTLTGWQAFERRGVIGPAWRAIRLVVGTALLARFCAWVFG